MISLGLDQGSSSHRFPQPEGRDSSSQPHGPGPLDAAVADEGRETRGWHMLLTPESATRSGSSSPASKGILEDEAIAQV